LVPRYWMGHGIWSITLRALVGSHPSGQALSSRRILVLGGIMSILKDEFKWSMYPRIKDEPIVRMRSIRMIRNYVSLAGLLYRHIHTCTMPLTGIFIGYLQYATWWCLLEGKRETTFGHNVVEVVTRTHFNRSESTIQSVLKLSIEEKEPYNSYLTTVKPETTTS
jgi:hypothetical protein